MINLSDIDALAQLTDQAALYRQLLQQIDDLERAALDGLREALSQTGVDAVRVRDKVVRPGVDGVRVWEVSCGSDNSAKI
jgi:glycine/D-amino acid oxidase-like deaminating enzyme